ncbi:MULTISPECIES: GTPase family protein [unclassified Streptomyces]|uniref:GTPase family protein n=1 Tax=unclassified Streptomyces TaxID=2593676 RepID=UPI00365D783A
MKNDIIGKLRASVARSGLSKEVGAQLVAETEEAIRREPPPVIALIGESGVGKSETINALFNAGQPVGHTRATTDRAYRIPIVHHEVEGGKGQGVLNVIDMPGIGDDARNHEAYRALYLKVLPQADVVLWVHAAEDRTVQLTQEMVRDIYVTGYPELANRLVFGLNKADQISPRDWNPQFNVPSAEQLRNLEERELDFVQRMSYVLPNWSSKVVCYSATKRYNLTALFKAMMYAVHKERRWVLESRMDIADITELVDRRSLAAATAQDHVKEWSMEVPSGAREQQPANVRSGRDATVSEAIAALPADVRLALLQDEQRLMEFIRDIEGGGA